MWIGALVELEGWVIYTIKFSQETTTNLFEVTDTIPYLSGLNISMAKIGKSIA